MSSLLNRRTKKNEGLEEEEEPLLLDETQQSKILDDLKNQATKQEISTRKLFYYFFLSLSLLFFILIILTFINPDIISHQRILSRAITKEIFLIYYFICFYNFIIAAIFIKNPNQDTTFQSLRIFSYILGFFSLFFWLYIFYSLGVTNYLLFWMPFSSLLGLLLGQYIDKDVKSLIAETNSLENYKYNLKSV